MSTSNSMNFFVTNNNGDLKKKIDDFELHIAQYEAGLVELAIMFLQAYTDLLKLDLMMSVAMTGYKMSAKLLEGVKNFVALLESTGLDRANIDHTF